MGVPSSFKKRLQEVVETPLGSLKWSKLKSGWKSSHLFVF